MTKKQIFTLAGQMDVACMVIQDVIMQLQVAAKRESTSKALREAVIAANKARAAVRAVSYEVEDAIE
jgi:hypothetical protein